jgi:alkanesulfonate monooxygenase SsuD/methylene tetrahydromethanopterin reductase-like flavin-dependent oxidoreductase (luciferase family)
MNAGTGAVGRLGLGLWTFQSTALSPASLTAQYRRYRRSAGLAEALGFHSLWTAEHRVWYDGWCPALLHAHAAVVPATERIRLGTAMLLAPQHDPRALLANYLTLDQLSGGRVELGLGLGHRAEEFEAVSMPRRGRGRRMDDALAVLADAGRPRVWVGGFSDPALKRAARGGHGIMLPQTLAAAEMKAMVERYRGLGGSGPVGALRDVWVESDAEAARRFEERLLDHYREEAGSWWLLGGKLGFAVPERLDAQMDRIAAAALVGPPDTVAAGLAELLGCGCDLLVLRPQFDFVADADLDDQIEAIAARVAPLLPDGGKA